MKKGLLFGVIVLLTGILLTGCPDPANPDPNPPPPPPAEPAKLDATLTIDAFLGKLEAGGTYEVPTTGTEITGSAGSGTFRVPEKTKLKLTGTLTLPDETIIIFKSKDSIEGTGKITGKSKGILIAADPSKSDIAGTNAFFAPLFTGAVLPAGEGRIVVDGDLTISGSDTAAAGTAPANIKAAELASKNLFVLGSVTVSAAVTAATIEVVGNLSATEHITVSMIDVSGTISAAVAGKGITANAIRVKGESSPAGASSSIGTLTNTEAAEFQFDGPTTIQTLTPGTGGVIIEGTGAVTITDSLGDTSTNTVKIRNQTGVTLSGKIGSHLTVAKAKVTGSTTGNAGVLIKSDASSITVNANESIAATAEGSQIVAGSGATTVTLTKATLGPGTYTAGTADFTLGTATEIHIADGGVAEIADGATLRLTQAASGTTASKLKVSKGGAVHVKKADSGGSGGGNIVNAAGDTQAGVTFGVLKVTTSGSGDAVSTNSSPSRWNISGTASNFTVTENSEGTGGTVTLGKITFTGGSNNNTVAGTPSSSAAEGKLTAGANTEFVISAAEVGGGG